MDRLNCLVTEYNFHLNKITYLGCSKHNPSKQLI